MTDVVARTVSVASQAEEPAVRSLLAAEPADVAGSFGKRAVDIAGAFFALLLFLPLLLCIAMAVRLESGGPVIFKQRRTGHCGRIFTIYKFRTMTVAEDCGNVRQATRDDARVTAIGGVLRKLSLDELPQFLNVLKGDMSLVGPRPHALAHDDYYGDMIPVYVDRFRAKPGLTGLAQVNGLRGEIQDLRCMRDRIAADNLYIDSWSLGLDVAILAKTALIIFRDPQAY
jgi:putative colanic acid biosynthesis UDP-glucose lipid carrier transferase